MDTLALKKMANEVRKGIVTAVHSAKSGHPGGSLSAADILTYLYFEEMNIDPKDPKKADRDRFVLSKGHIAPALYSTLAHRGYFPVEDLTTLRHVGSYLQGHPDMKHIPGVDMSSGSLGQGSSAAVGMALAGKLDFPLTPSIESAGILQSSKINSYVDEPRIPIFFSFVPKENPGVPFSTINAENFLTFLPLLSSITSV